MSDASQKVAYESTRLQAFKNVCHKWLYMEDDDYIDIVFGTVFANRLDAKPVWLFLVGAPGGGKTEIVQPLDGHSTIYALSKLTPHTLISGKIQEPGERDDPSLLPKLDGKVLVIKDFTVMLKGRNEDIRDIFGQFRDCYDGTARNGYGTGKDEKYTSKFGIVAAVTSEIDRHLPLLASLGERFLTYRLPKPSEAEIEARTDLASQNKSAEAQEREIREAAHAVLDLEPNPAGISEELRAELGKMARFVALARTPVQRDRQTKEIESAPESEVPTRLVKQFVSLAQGIAMARERADVTPDEVRLVYRVALGSIPPVRLDVLRRLMAVYPKSMTAKGVAERIRISDSTVQRCFEDLHALGIVQRSKADSNPTRPLAWTATGKYGEFLREAEI